MLSVIICTHNPRRDYLGRVLQAIEAQTLSKQLWELLVIDNASDRLLSSEIDLSWHPHARHIREDKLGLTPARLRGIQEAQADILVFVDDDNVLEPDYLELALHIGKDWSILGAWGGQAIGEFEQQPPDWTKPYWGFLAIREFNQDKWSNLLHQLESTPFGAGLCIRKVVAQKYAELVRSDSKRANLDRKGKLLLSCGDIDLAFTACDIGFGTGIFSSLKLTHLMPASRLQEEYLLRIVEGTNYSHLILDFFRGKTAPKPSWKSQLLHQPRRWFMKPRERKFYDAYFRGRNLAMKEISQLSVKEETSV